MSDKFRDIDIPMFAPDERQSFFYKAVDHLTDKVGDASVVNTTTGFPASCVNLGWLQKALEFLVRNDRIETKDDVCDFVMLAVNRVKYIKVSIIEGFEKNLKVYFKTKDDHGWYCYEIGVYDPRGIKITNVPVEACQL